MGVERSAKIKSQQQMMIHLDSGVLCVLRIFQMHFIWSWPTLAKTDFDLCVWCCVVCVLCGVVTCFTVWSGVSCVGVGFKVWFGPSFPWTAQNFALLSLSRSKIRSFFSLWGVCSWNFGVFEAPGRKNNFKKSKQKTQKTKQLKISKKTLKKIQTINFKHLKP